MTKNNNDSPKSKTEDHSNFLTEQVAEMRASALRGEDSYPFINAAVFTPTPFRDDQDIQEALIPCLAMFISSLHARDYEKRVGEAVLNIIGEFLRKLEKTAKEKGIKITPNDLRKMFHLFDADIQGKIVLTEIRGIPFEIDVERPEKVLKERIDTRSPGPRLEV